MLVSSRKAVPDPKTTARTLLDRGPEEKLLALQTMGVDSEPAVHGIWLSFQREMNLSEGQIAGKWLSTGVPGVIYDNQFQPLEELNVGFTEDEQSQFWIETFARQEQGIWYRIATVGCLCNVYRIDDLPLRPWMKKKQEIAYSIVAPRANALGWDIQKLRFRLRGNDLIAVFSAEKENWSCPDGEHSGRVCIGTQSNLQPAKLIDKQGHTHAGYALWTSEMTRPLHDKVPAVGKPVFCTPYIWDEVVFRYEVSHWKAASCGRIPEAVSQP